MQWMFTWMLAVTMLTTDGGFGNLSGRPEKPLPVAYSSGSPYFTETYHTSTILLKRDRKILAPARINLYRNEVQFIVNGVEAVLKAAAVKEVSFTDTTSEGITPYLLRTGFPAFERRGTDCFYIVLADGKCCLLKLIEKKRTEQKNAATDGLLVDYVDMESYYLFHNGSVKHLKRDKDFLLAELSDKQAQLTEYIDSAKLRFGTIDQITRLVNYYNSL
jgi:hypothetical protein